MGRPKKIDQEKLSKRLPAPRCTETELSIVQKRAEKAGLHISEYMRRMAIDGKLTIRNNTTSVSFSAIQELKKQGLNLNQMVKNMHIFSCVEQKALLQLKEKLDRIYDKVLAHI
jgi:hypothetical protein